jgi:glucose/arabinose dehydrogenase
MSGVFFCLIGAAVAAPPAVVECRWADTPIVLDGTSTEPAWAGTGPFRLAWDRSHLYFFATESGSYYLKPGRDEPGVYELNVTPDGLATACFCPKRGAEWTPEGACRVEAKAAGGAVEGRIAWAEFLRAGGRPNPGDEWQLLAASARPLKFVGPPAPPVPPPAPSAVVGSPDPPLPYRVKRVYPKFSPEWPIQVRAVPGTDQMLVITESGPYGPTQLYRFKDDPAVTTADAVKIMDLPHGGVAYDIAFHPKFADNGFVYIGWNTKFPEKGKNFTLISRYTMGQTAPYSFDTKSEVPIIEWESNGHNGGAVCFGPDGFMYVTSGDGTADSDGNLMGQRTDVLLAKAFRIDVDHPTKDKPYSVPGDNPFVGDKRFAPETWAYGLRNPWRISSDAVSGQVWVGNNGQDLWETAHLLRKGENYGWSVKEGSHDFYPNRTAGPTPIVPPTVEHHHSEARSLTGGLVVRSPALPDLAGAYVYGDYSTGRIWAVKHDGSKIEWHKELASSHLQITAFSTNTKGELLILDHHASGEGGFYTLEPAPAAAGTKSFPRKLSETGLFSSVKDHQLHPGLVPYDVVVPFWSDGLAKTRALYLPPGGRIGYTANRGWNFPDLTVLVKSFASAPGQWVETRLLTKQAGEWVGYSYHWNDAGTDADLVPSGGADREITVEGKKQLWHYPSRAECMVCHSRAANFVLGLCDLQMNKGNQISEWERRGLFSVDWTDEARDQIAKQIAAKALKGKEVEKYRDARNPQPGQTKPKDSVFLPTPAEEMKTLVDPQDVTKTLEARAKSWLHANCSMCHVEAGGGNARMELEFGTALNGMRVLDVAPLHATFDLKDAKLIASGDPDRSVILKRAGTRGKGQMPPLASNRVDEEGVKLLREWVQSLPR